MLVAGLRAVAFLFASPLRDPPRELLALLLFTPSPRSSNSSSCQKKSGNSPRRNALEFDGSAPKSEPAGTSLPLFVLHRFLLTSFLVTFSLYLFSLGLAASSSLPFFFSPRAKRGRWPSAPSKFVSPWLAMCPIFFSLQLPLGRVYHSSFDEFCFFHSSQKERETKRRKKKKINEIDRRQVSYRPRQKVTISSRFQRHNRQTGSSICDAAARFPFVRDWRCY